MAELKQVDENTPNERLAVEEAAFRRLRPQLMARYPGLFVAIYGERVVDQDEDDEALALRLFERFGYVPVYIARVEENPTILEMPSPEVVG